MTKRVRKPKSYGKRLKKCMRGRPPKEVVVDPRQEQINIPDTMRLTQRPVCNQRTDERPMLRTEDGRVMATVEFWMAPEQDLLS